LTGTCREPWASASGSSQAADTKLGIVEFRGNDFIESVAASLHDVPADFIRSGQVLHPSPPPYRVIIDRVSFCDPFLRRLMCSWSIAGAYVLNDPFFTQVFDKFSELQLYDALGISHARTMLLPRVNRAEDVREIVAPPDWPAIEGAIGFPCVLKPVEGYAWQDVFTAESPAGLRGLYESLGDRQTLMVQELIRYSAYYRAFCIDKREVFIVGWKPLPFDQGEYFLPDPAALAAVEEHITSRTIALNAALGLDFNAVEWCVTPGGQPVVIDSFNDVPDVRKEKLPPACFQWVVERFCACVRSKLASGERNRFAPNVPLGSEAGTSPR
jgi:hypothetical protein